MDSSITPLRHGGLSLVQTTDFFYPLVEDPYMQGNELKFRDIFCHITRNFKKEVNILCIVKMIFYD